MLPADVTDASDVRSDASHVRVLGVPSDSVKSSFTTLAILSVVVSGSIEVKAVVWRRFDLALSLPT